MPSAAIAPGTAPAPTSRPRSRIDHRTANWAVESLRAEGRGQSERLAGSSKRRHGRRQGCRGGGAGIPGSCGLDAAGRGALGSRTLQPAGGELVTLALETAQGSAGARSDSGRRRISSWTAWSVSRGFEGLDHREPVDRRPPRLPACVGRAADRIWARRKRHGKPPRRARARSSPAGGSNRPAGPGPGTSPGTHPRPREDPLPGSGTMPGPSPRGARPGCGTLPGPPRRLDERKQSRSSPSARFPNVPAVRSVSSDDQAACGLPRSMDGPRVGSLRRDRASPTVDRVPSAD